MNDVLLVALTVQLFPAVPSGTFHLYLPDLEALFL